jgi:RNA polymerase sigma-70 factor, ECF subfamily
LCEWAIRVRWRAAESIRLISFARRNFEGFPLTFAGARRLSLIARSPLIALGHPEHEPTVDDLLAAHADAVYRYALRLTREPQAAQDLSQETLLRGWRARGSLREPAAARVWLLRIATNLHRDQCRAARRVEQLTEEPIDLRVIAPDALAHRECVGRALAALDALPTRQRQAMHLITIEQISHQEAAGVLGVTADALKASLSLARRQMRERLRDIYDDIRGARSES